MSNKIKEFVITPSSLSYLCNHCLYMKQNHGLQNSSISAGITGTLDSIEKNFFLGNSKKIDDSLQDGQTIDPLNGCVYSKVLLNGKKRAFRITGKGDAIIKFNDGTSGIIDYKTSKFKKKNPKDYSFNDAKLKHKVNEYDSQLHSYFLLYSNLETNIDFLQGRYKKRYPRSLDPLKIKAGADKTIEKINQIKISNTPSLFGLVFVYPEEDLPVGKINLKKGFSVPFSYKFEKVEINIKNYIKKVTNLIDMLILDEPPNPPESCGCNLYKYFYDKKKLKTTSK